MISETLIPIMVPPEERTKKAFSDVRFKPFFFFFKRKNGCVCRPCTDPKSMVLLFNYNHNWAIVLAALRHLTQPRHSSQVFLHFVFHLVTFIRYLFPHSMSSIFCTNISTSTSTTFLLLSALSGCSGYL